MPKYYGKQIFTHEVVQKQKTERERKKKEYRKLVITWPATHCKGHLGWRTQSRLGHFNHIKEDLCSPNVSYPTHYFFSSTKDKTIYKTKDYLKIPPTLR